jgi:hypothetical protein
VPGFRWWEDLGPAVVGVDPDLPGGVVDDPVVVTTQEHEVGGVVAGQPRPSAPAMVPAVGSDSMKAESAGVRVCRVPGVRACRTVPEGRLPWHTSSPCCCRSCARLATRISTSSRFIARPPKCVDGQHLVRERAADAKRPAQLHG